MRAALKALRDLARRWWLYTLLTCVGFKLSTNTKHEVVYINLDDAVTVTRNDVAERGWGDRLDSLI
jgi:hypothetical protein